MTALYVCRWGAPLSLAMWAALAACVVALTGCDASNQPVSACAYACTQNGGRMKWHGVVPVGDSPLGIPMGTQAACVCEYPARTP